MIVIPDAEDEVSETRITVPKESQQQIVDGRISLGITTDNIKVMIPNDSLRGFTEELYSRFIPVKEAAAKREIKERANQDAIVKIVVGNQEVAVVGRPMTVETNMQYREVMLVMPLYSVSLSPEELNSLAIYIEHSDGTKQLLRGAIVDYNSKGDKGIQFTVNKFSTFTVVTAPAVKPNQHAAYMNGYNDGTFRPTQSTLNFTSDKAGTYSYLDYKSSGPVPDAATVKLELRFYSFSNVYELFMNLIYIDLRPYP